MTNLFSCLGTLFVTNGTVAADNTVVGANTNGVGQLIISGPGVLMNTPSGSQLSMGNGGSWGNSLIVTNGGKLFVDGTTTFGGSAASSNNLVLFSGPTSAGTFTSLGRITWGGNSGQLIITNGAKINTTGSLLFGNGCSFNTGVVVGVGSAIIGTAASSYQFGTGSTGGTNNFFIVSDGGFISGGGTFAFGNNSLHVNDGIQIGGSGSPSTGLFTVVRSASNNTNHFACFMNVTNAFVHSYYLNPQGPGESVRIFKGGVWNLTNSLTIAQATNTAVNINTSSGTLLIDGGTLIDLRTTNNSGGLALAGTGVNTPETGRYGNMMIVTNGGKLLTSSGTIGAASGFNTAMVVGASSVWSNFSGQAVDPTYTNFLIVGTGTSATNFLGVADGATLYNNGTLNIGNTVTAALNVVSFGGVGAASTVVNTGTINIGSGAGSVGNKLIVTNATLTSLAINVGISSTNVFGGSLTNSMELRGGTVSAGTMIVRPTNSVLFTAGTLSVGNMRFDTLANNSNAFVAGDGTSAAFYDMAAGGTGYHDFNTQGLTVTNGATLRGNGTLVGNVRVLGTFAPGFSPGTVLTSNDLFFGSTAVLNYDLGTSPDTVTVKGALTLGGTVNVSDSGGFAATTYSLFTITNTASGPAGTLAVGTIPAGFSAIVSTNTPGLVQLIVSVAGGGDPYTTWAGFYGLAGANALGTADPDGDGMSNTNEFLAGFKPNNSAAYVHVISVAQSGTNITVTYLASNGDSNGSAGPKTNVLESTTGTPPNYTNNFVTTGQTNVFTGGTGLGTVASFIHTNGATGTSRYYRVRVLP